MFTVSTSDIRLTRRLNLRRREEKYCRLSVDHVGRDDPVLDDLVRGNEEEEMSTMKGLKIGTDTPLLRRASVRWNRQSRTRHMDTSLSR